MTRDELVGICRRALLSPYVLAFLRVVREGESSQDPDAYRMMFGGQLAERLDDHPRVAFQSRWGWTSAAGAYQFMCVVPGRVVTNTWGECVEALGLTDFSPDSQNLAAVYLIRRRGALDPLLQGQWREAIKLCGKEWASLPDSPYGQTMLTWERAERTWHEWLQFYEGAAHPAAPDPAPPAQSTREEADVAPVLMLAPAIMQVLSQLFAVFQPLARDKLAGALGKATKDPAMAGTIADQLLKVATDAAGITTPPPNASEGEKLVAAAQAVAEIRSQPELVPQVQAAMLSKVDELMPVVDRLDRLEKEAWAASEDSADRAAARARGDDPDQDRTLTWGILGMMGVVLLSLGAGIVLLIVNDKPYGEILALASAAIGVVLGKFGTRYDYRYGSSRMSSAKDFTIAKLTERRE